MSEIYIGLMSGTSMDSIDAVCVDFANPNFEILECYSQPFPIELKNELISLCQPGLDEINRLGQMDRKLGFLFAQACQKLLQKTQLTTDDIIAIGSHGQTIRHQPTLDEPFTLQIGDPNVIAAETGIKTIADFRRRDMVCGGQGAPLTPAFHHFAFAKPEVDRVVVNIGGIANLTYLPGDITKSVSGFDSGPGNTLLDSWIKQHHNLECDHDGKWSSEGRVNEKLLAALLNDPFFSMPPPKSTGKEYFNLAWLENFLTPELSANDVQTTLCELTAVSILQAISEHTSTACQILLCGGGVHNKDLAARLNRHKGRHQLASTQEFGLDPDWVEAVAFAWLARQTMLNLPGNLPSVTGATRQTILGGIWSN